MATFDYTSRDYLSIRQDLVNRASLNIEEWDTSDASEFGNVFIDLWAYMGDVLHFYIDRAASETFLETATQRESVIAIANLMDYLPASTRSSRGTCSVRLTSFPSGSAKNYDISSAACSTVTIGGTPTVIVTYTTASNHELTTNQRVTVSGMSPTTFNVSNVEIYDAPTSDTFRVLASQFSSPPTSGTNSTAGGDLDYNLAYTIPQDTVFSSYDSSNNLIDFYTMSPISIDRTNTNFSVSLVQGRIIRNELLGTSSGRSNQTITLSRANVDIDSVIVQVYEGALSGGSPTAVPYQYVSNLSSSIYADKVFTTRLTSDGYVQVIFGNGFNGYIPTTNANILASYRTTDGALGNLPANSIRFVTGDPSSYIDIVSSTSFSGGANVESLESIRTNVSRLFRTQDRAVSLQDYKDLTLQIPGVSKATATYSNPNVTLYPVPHLSIYPPAPVTAGSQKVVIEIPTPMAESIDNYFTTRSMLGVTASVVNPTNHGTIDKYIECTPVYVGMQIYVRDNFVQSWVKDEVTAAIKNLLTFELAYFGQTLTVGEIYRAALSVNGVDYVVLTNLSTTYDATPETVSTVGNVSADSTKLLCFTDAMTLAPSAVNLWMQGGITGSN
jgi:hypothetical protein